MDSDDASRIKIWQQGCYLYASRPQLGRALVLKFEEETLVPLGVAAVPSTATQVHLMQLQPGCREVVVNALHKVLELASAEKV